MASSFPSTTTGPGTAVGRGRRVENSAKTMVSDQISQAVLSTSNLIHIMLQSSPSQDNLVKLPKNLLAKASTINNTNQVLDQMPWVISSLEAHMDHVLQSVPHLETVTRLLSNLENSQLKPLTNAQLSLQTEVDWTSELHKKLEQAVEQFGVEQAIPSRILELMNVKGLTRHNVASHLQKYRLQRRHILPKESGRKWPQTRHSTPRNYYPQKAIMAYPPLYHSNHTLPATHVYPAWQSPPNYTHPPQMWAPPYYPAWQSSKNWMWNPYSRVPAEAWGFPTVPRHTSFPQNASQFQRMDSMQISQIMAKNSFDHYPGDEVIDKVVKEAINKPWVPLPLGLKPPSTEGVIYELVKQGISSVPPRTINGCDEQ